MGEKREIRRGQGQQSGDCGEREYRVRVIHCCMIIVFFWIVEPAHTCSLTPGIFLPQTPCILSNT